MQTGSLPKEAQKEDVLCQHPWGTDGHRVPGQGRADPEEKPCRQEVWVPGLQHLASRFSDLRFLLAQALVLFRGWVEDVVSGYFAAEAGAGLLS